MDTGKTTRAKAWAAAGHHTTRTGGRGGIFYETNGIFAKTRLCLQAFRNTRSSSAWESAKILKTCGHTHPSSAQESAEGVTCLLGGNANPYFTGPGVGHCWGRAAALVCSVGPCTCDPPLPPTQLASPTASPGQRGRRSPGGRGGAEAGARIKAGRPRQEGAGVGHGGRGGGGGAGGAEAAAERGRDRARGLGQVHHGRAPALPERRARPAPAPEIRG